MFLKISTPMLGLINTLGKDAGSDCDVAKLVDKFTWIDDGARNMEVTLHEPQEP